MHSHACRYKFCNSQDAKMNLPLYSVDAKNHTDIIHVFQCAKDNDLYVSVKTTGHSYTGSSTEEGSLLVWMHNYEKDLTIHESYKNSCQASHEKYVGHDVISIGEGAVWDDVIEAVKDNFQYSLLASDYGKYWELISKAVAQFFEFWIEKSPDLSNNW